MLDDFMLDKDLNKIKMIINIEKFDDAKILIGTDDKLSGDVTIKNVILIASAINGDDKFYPQIFSEEYFYWQAWKTRQQQQHWSKNVFHHWKIKRKRFWIFTEFCEHDIKMETQKIANFLSSSETEFLKFATKT